MLFGENGCGKSTIVDAFGFVGRRDYGSISDHPGYDNNFVTAIGCAPANTSVVLKTSAGSWTAKLGKKKSIEVVPEVGCPRLEILRRKQILDLVDAQPKNRFTELSKYIDVSGVSQSEQSLRDAIRDTANDLETEIRLKGAAEDHLNQFWVNEGKKGTTSLVWAKAEAAKELGQLNGTIKVAKAIASSISEAENKLTEWSAYLERCKKTKAELTQADLDFQQVSAQSATQSGELLRVLQEAKTFLAKNSDAATCPVCVRPITALTLSADIDARISAMSKLADAALLLEGAKRKVTIAEGQQADELRKIVDAITKTINVVVDADLAALGLQPTAKQPWQDLNAINVDLDRIGQLTATITAFAPALAIVLKSGEDAQKIANQHSAICGHVKQVESSSAKVTTLDAVKRLLDALLSVIDTERKAFVSEVLTTISTDVEALYSRVHPDESVGGVKLSLDPRYIGSLHLHADFHSEKNITPQSVFSESHLDTLGLCVFLALAKRYSAAGSIIILDDVLTSVDAAHLDRVITLLHDEATHFGHTLITTHYRPWRDRYRFHRAPTANIAFVELRPWSLETGIRLSKSHSSLADLKAALGASAFDRQAVASKAGQLLENLLDFLARTYRCRLPLTGQPHYTLAELLDCFSKDLRKVLRVDRLDAALKPDTAIMTEWVSTPIPPLLESLKTLAFVRNHVGAHYNTLGSDCTDAEVEKFAKMVTALGDLLVCPKGGDLPDRNKTGSHHQSKSGHVRLFPLEEPS